MFRMGRGGKHNDGYMLKPGGITNLAQAVQPVPAGHIDVQENNIRRRWMGNGLQQVSKLIAVFNSSYLRRYGSRCKCFLKEETVLKS